MTRAEARRKIVEAANAHIRSNGRSARSLNRRHIQEAVCIVRRHILVKPEVLEAAGYRVRS